MRELTWKKLIVMNVLAMIFVIGMFAAFSLRTTSSEVPMPQEVTAAEETEASAVRGEAEPSQTGSEVLVQEVVEATLVPESTEDVEVPQSILDFVAEYPQARSLATNYATYRDVVYDGDLAKEPTQNGIPRLLQWDKRWGYTSYGEGYFGVTGCGPTCLAMIYAGLSGDYTMTPDAFGAFAMEHDYYVPEVGTKWKLMEDGAAEFGLYHRSFEPVLGTLLYELSNDHPLIASMEPGDFTNGGHFIVLCGLDEEGKVIVNDPNSPANSARTWDAQTIVAQAKQFWSYRTR